MEALPRARHCCSSALSQILWAILLCLRILKQMKVQGLLGRRFLVMKKVVLHPTEVIYGQICHVNQDKLTVAVGSSKSQYSSIK